jgi:hypothetical protein
MQHFHVAKCTRKLNRPFFERAQIGMFSNQPSSTQYSMSDACCGKKGSMQTIIIQQSCSNNFRIFKPVPGDSTMTTTRVKTGSNYRYRWLQSVLWLDFEGNPQRTFL